MIMPVENSQTEKDHDYEKHRKRFSRLVICKDCVRSYDAKYGSEETNNCKFCGSSSITVKGKHVFKYFCPTCDTSFISEEKEAHCRKCSAQYLHMMRLSELSKDDKMEIRKAKIKGEVKGVHKLLKLNFGKLRNRGRRQTDGVHPEIKKYKENKLEAKHHKPEIDRRLWRQPARNKRKPLFYNHKKHEEMPTY